MSPAFPASNRPTPHLLHSAELRATLFDSLEPADALVAARVHTHWQITALAAGRWRPHRNSPTPLSPAEALTHYATWRAQTSFTSWRGRFDTSATVLLPLGGLAVAVRVGALLVPRCLEQPCGGNPVCENSNPTAYCAMATQPLAIAAAFLACAMAALVYFAARSLVDKAMRRRVQTLATKPEKLSQWGECRAVVRLGEHLHDAVLRKRRADVEKLRNLGASEALLDPATWQQMERLCRSKAPS